MIYTCDICRTVSSPSCSPLSCSTIAYTTPSSPLRHIFPSTVPTSNSSAKSYSPPLCNCSPPSISHLASLAIRISGPSRSEPSCSISRPRRCLTPHTLYILQQPQHYPRTHSLYPSPTLPPQPLSVGPPRALASASRMLLLVSVTSGIVVAAWSRRRV
ncbi:hypothetical protein BD414DRAFT_14408 [Trametes punicea]|nr:hypothetical protein BD414DRAFT_14408 [Trametes punicea]